MNPDMTISRRAARWGDELWIIFKSISISTGATQENIISCFFEGSFVTVVFTLTLKFVSDDTIEVSTIMELRKLDKIRSAVARARPITAPFTDNSL
jgi:hypothetical protein